MDIFTLAHWGASIQRLPTTRLFARSYGMCTSSFYFSTIGEFNTKARKIRENWGGLVEFNIVFTDGDDLDAEIFKTSCINENNLDKFLNVVKNWSKDEKTKALIYAREHGKSFEDVAGFITTCRKLDWETMQYRIAEMQEEMQEFYP